MTDLDADAALDQARRLVRAGRLEDARAIVLEGQHRQRALLSIALAERDHAEAVRLARELMIGGWRDPIVLATLVAHGDEGEKPAAAAELALAAAYVAVGRAPGASQAWEDLIDLSVALGRAQQAAETVQRAADENLINAGPWRLLVLALIQAGEPQAALQIARVGATYNADDAELLASIAFLNIELELDPDEARTALSGAEAADPRHPFVWLARAMLAVAIADTVAAEHAIETARTLGVPRVLLDVLKGTGRPGPERDSTG